MPIVVYVPTCALNKGKQIEVRFNKAPKPNHRFSIMAQLANIPARLIPYDCFAFPRKQETLMEALTDAKAFITLIPPPLGEEVSYLSLPHSDMITKHHIYCKKHVY